jgi:hypothetical protein
MFRHRLHRATPPFMPCNRANDAGPSHLIGQNIHSRTWTGEKALLGGQGATVPVRVSEISTGKRASRLWTDCVWFRKARRRRAHPSTLHGRTQLVVTQPINSRRTRGDYTKKRVVASTGRRIPTHLRRPITFHQYLPAHGAPSARIFMTEKTVAAIKMLYTESILAYLTTG